MSLITTLAEKPCALLEQVSVASKQCFETSFKLELCNILSAFENAMKNFIV